MDENANTHILTAPVAEESAELEGVASHSAYLLIVEGGIPGTLLKLGAQGASLGRAPENSFEFLDHTVSRRHASISMDPTGRATLTDEGSTNGTFLNGARIQADTAVDLADGDRIRLGRGVLLKLVRLDGTDERFQREMFELAVRDSLTGFYNRSYFLNQIAALADRSAAQGLGLAVLMLDIDHFKRINDRYGHVAGDEVLQQVARVIRETTRDDDLVARYGGDEFIIALPVAAPDLATRRAHKIRANLAARRLSVCDQSIRVTASVGLVYVGSRRSVKPRSLIIAADQALYRAKADGRNRVVFGRVGVFHNEKGTDAADGPSPLCS